MTGREFVAELAAASGWRPVDALYADGYARGDETLTVVHFEGRVLHVCHTVYEPGSNDTISRRALAGSEGIALAIDILAASARRVAA